MDLNQLQDFFFWCMIINLGVYIITAVAAFSMKGFVCRVQKRLFNLDEAESLKYMQSYFANYKLLVTVFNFTPWIVLLIMK